MNLKNPFVTLLLLFGIYTSNAQQLQSFFQKADDFLKTHVQNGKVNYAEIQNNKSSLSELSNLIGSISPDDLRANDRKAFLINAYNLLVIKGIVNSYPLTSTQKVNGFFEKIKHNVGGHPWTLNEIENEQIRPIYNDPRVHFVLNCAALSCPPVTNFAYLPESLDTQLDQQTRLALNDNSFIYTKNGKNYISNIFKWYKGDFTDNGTVVDYINQYRLEKLSTENRTVHYPYDWTLNDNVQIEIGDASNQSFVQTYTPSSLLKKGQIEVQLFNNLYTQTAFRNESREKIDLGERQNYFTSLVNLLYGVSKNNRINVGMDINVRSVKVDTEGSSPFRVLGFSANDAQNRRGISSLGPVVKFVPFKKYRLSIKSSFLIPLTDDSESDARNNPWFDWNRYTWWNQFFYDKNIGDKWQIFLEGDLLFRFAKSASSYENNLPKQDLIDFPMSTFISYFPTTKTTVYAMVQYAPRYGFNKVDTGEKVSDFHSQGDFAQAGLGFKYQVLEKLGLELMVSNFFTSQSQGAGSTFNLGIRYIN